jgi:Flp pilus assembly protein TadB
MLTRIKLWAAAVGAALLALWAMLARAKRDGRKQEQAKAKEADHAKAAAVRDRVRDARRVSTDDLKYRD